MRDPFQGYDQRKTAAPEEPEAPPYQLTLDEDGRQALLKILPRYADAMPATIDSVRAWRSDNPVRELCLRGLELDYRSLQRIVAQLRDMAPLGEDEGVPY